jgi:hypothetical protein
MVSGVFENRMSGLLKPDAFQIVTIENGRPPWTKGDVLNAPGD